MDDYSLPPNEEYDNFYLSIYLTAPFLFYPQPKYLILTLISISNPSHKHDEELSNHLCLAHLFMHH